MGTNKQNTKSPGDEVVALNEQEKIKALNKLLMGMLQIEPLIEFKEPLTELGHEQFHALAQMYSNRGFRSYLEIALSKATKQTALHSEDLVSLAYNKSRMIVLKELLAVSKKAFEDIAKLKNGKT